MSTTNIPIFSQNTLFIENKWISNYLFILKECKHKASNGKYSNIELDQYKNIINSEIKACEEFMFV